MARIKQAGRRQGKPLITWTRFYLPRYQEWPEWPVGYDDIHAGPVLGYSIRKLRLARMVDDPEQAAYIIEWRKPEEFKSFQSSPACTIFLNDLPESKDAAAAASQAGAQLEQLTLDDNATPAPSSPAKSRFLLCRHSTERATRDLDGLVTMTAFLIPGQSDLREPAAHAALLKTVEDTSRQWPVFTPLRPCRLPVRHAMSTSFSSIWRFVLEEDSWVTDKFGALSSQPHQVQALQQQQQQQTQQSVASRGVIYHIFRWNDYYVEPYEAEAIAAEDPEAKKAWEEFASRFMPPATALAQERWDIRDIPEFDPPDIEEGSYWEEVQDLTRRINEFCGGLSTDASEPG